MAVDLAGDAFFDVEEENASAGLAGEGGGVAEGDFVGAGVIERDEDGFVFGENGFVG